MEYSIKLTEQELNILSAALVELPFKVAAPLIAKINSQIAERQNAKKETPAPSGASTNNI